MIKETSAYQYTCDLCGVVAAGSLADGSDWVRLAVYGPPLLGHTLNVDACPACQRLAATPLFPVLRTAWARMPHYRQNKRVDSWGGVDLGDGTSRRFRRVVATAARRPTFYIATRGAAAYLPRVRALAGALTAAGYEWTHDWTKTIDEADARGITSDRQLPLDEQMSVARIDKAAVLEADILVYLSPDEHHRSEGAAWELGLHHARCLYEGGFSVVVGTPSCLFAQLADRRVKSDSDVLGVVADLLSDGRLLRVLLSPPEGA